MGSAVNRDAIALGRYLPAIVGASGFGGVDREANYRDKSEKERRNNPLFR
jgi:hypothetical protein